ncbi:MAG: alanine--glyoxylate aminotransferase family protein [Candidatus Hadarchaeales archaeon]
MKLFTAGPVACRPEVLQEMSRQMFSHRSKEYQELQKQVVEGMQRFLETKSHVFLFPSSGSGAMEASIRNCVERKVLCCICGEFGERYARVAQTNGREVVRLEVELGKPITPELLDEQLKHFPDVEAVTITHNETSVGLLNPLRELAKVAKEREKLVLVDAVSSMGGTEIKFDEWGLDVCFTSSQKCFGLPPGLAIVAVSAAAMERSARAVNKGWYFDFKLFEADHLKRLSTPMTPSIPQILGLRKELEIIEREGGKERRFELYRERMRRIKEGVESLGLSLFPQPGYESPTIACVNAPPGKTGDQIYEAMRAKGFELARGYGKLRERTFRIGNMGYITFEDIDQMLSALREVVA